MAISLTRVPLGTLILETRLVILTVHVVVLPMLVYTGVHCHGRYCTRRTSDSARYTTSTVTILARLFLLVQIVHAFNFLSSPRQSKPRVSNVILSI